MNTKTLATSTQAWWAYFITAMFVMYQFILSTSPSVMIPDLILSFETTAVHVAFLSSTFNYAYLIMQLPSGLLIDRYGVRTILLSSLGFCLFSSVLYAMAPNFLTLELARFLMGVASAPAVALTLYLCATRLPLGYFALAAGLMEMLGMLGGGIGQLAISEMLMFQIPWTHSILYITLFGVALWFLSFLYVKEDELSSTDNSKTSYKALWQLMKVMMKSKQIWFNGIYAALMFTVISGFGAFWNIPFLQTRFDEDINLIASCNSLVFIGAAVGTPFMGWLSGLIGKRTPLMMLGALACGGIECTIIYAPINSMYIMGVLLALLGFFSGAYVLPFAIVREQVNAKSQGAAMAFTNMLCTLLGSPVFQPLIGILLNVFHIFNDNSNSSAYVLIDYQCALSVLILATFIAFIVTFLIKDRSTE